VTDPNPAETLHEERLVELAGPAGAVAATLAEGLDAEQLQALDDRRTLAEHERAERTP
jgi:hypothetical protein